MGFDIQRAERTQSRLRFALSGASGSGKTWSALLVAKGLVEAMIATGVLKGGIDGKIGVVDTERKSARLYDRVVQFDVIELDPPYSPQRYLDAVKTFEDAGYPVIIIDQISHAWAGSGGLLESKNKVAKSEGHNSFDAWADITPVQNDFIERLLGSSAHLIVTMRAKTEWVLEEYQKRNGSKGTKPKRIGMAPIQRAGTEYEFTSLLNLDTDGNAATAQKDRTGLFTEGELVGRLSEKTGAALARWLYEPTLPAEATRGLVPAPERLNALVTTHEAAFKQCRTLPDLAKRYEVAVTEIKAVDTGGYLKNLAVNRLAVSKDQRKAELGGTTGKPSPAAAKAAQDPATVISPDQAIELEQYLQMARISLSDFSQEFGVDRLSLLPLAKLDDVKDWIDAQSVIGQA